ncbi:MAG: hypothetical protein FJW39_07955 [Acidobacteria bacterium]|nr:hypothetical protein [Acidobacteriota bacterium]
MDHQTASRDRFAERYSFGDLNPAECEEFEAHLFDCTECSRVVQESAVFEANLKDVLRNQAPMARLAPVVGFPGRIRRSIPVAIAAAAAGAFLTWSFTPGARVVPAAALLIPAAPETLGAPVAIERQAGQAFFLLALDLPDEEGPVTWAVHRAKPDGTPDGNPLAGGKLAVRGDQTSTQLGIQLPGDTIQSGRYVAVLKAVSGKTTRHPFVVR